MTVDELREKLKDIPGDYIVKTWDAYNDQQTEDVIVSTDGKGIVWIMDTTIGYYAV